MTISYHSGRETHEGVSLPFILSALLSRKVDSCASLMAYNLALGAPKLDATDTIATALAAIIGSPLLVIGQALEQAENTIQGISNLSARKKMEYLKYCLAILQYLESENALVE